MKDRSKDTSVAGSDLKTALAAATVTTPSPDAIDDTINAMVKEQEALLSNLKTIGYGAVECNASDGKVTERFGNKSCAAIEAMVTVNVLGMKIPVTIWGRLSQKADGTEISFEASAPRGFKFVGDGKTLLLAHVENAAAAWNGYDKATLAAESRLLGTAETMVGAGGQTISRPKLVKRVIVQTVAASSAAPTAA